MTTPCPSNKRRFDDRHVVAIFKSLVPLALAVFAGAVAVGRMDERVKFNTQRIDRNELHTRQQLSSMEAKIDRLIERGTNR